MNDDQLRSAFDDLVAGLPDDRTVPATTVGRAVRRRRLKVGAGALGSLAVAATAGVLVVGATSPEAQRLLPPATQPSVSAVPSPGTSQAPSPVPDPAPSRAPGQVPSTGPSALPGTTPGPGTTQGPSSAPATRTRVVLRPDGLGFTDGGSSTSALTFGSDAATVRDALDRALGEGGEMQTPDCGAGSSTVQYDGLFALLQDGAFVGWTTGSPGLATGDGLEVGVTLAELRAAIPDVQVSEGTVGAEWSAAGDGGLAGFLDGTDETSLVTGITAGARCIAR